MNKLQKTSIIIILILLGIVYILNIEHKTPTTPINRPATTTPTCGLFVTSPTPHGKVALTKPITVTGIIDNTDYKTRGCSWQMFEGQAGTAQAFIFINNQWVAISQKTPVPVANWMTEKTTFTVELGVTVNTSTLTEGIPVQVIFTEENTSGEPPVDTYTLPLTLTVSGELK